MASCPVFKYTASNRALTNEQRQFYEDNGFIIIRGLVSPADLDRYQQRFIDFCDGKVDKGGMTVMKDLSLLKEGKAKGEYLVNKIQEFLYDDVLFDYAKDPKIVEVVASIIGDNVTAVHSMLINKPPDAHEATSKHPLHQDLHYFPFRPADKICASWTAMERIDEKNGCLFAVPGSHKLELYAHVYPDALTNKAYHGVIGFDDKPKVMMIMEKGDTAFFHPILLHGSGPNLTKGFRKAISVHYASSDCHFIDVKGTTQQNIADEVEAIAKKRGISVDYRVIWKMKSRLVAGQLGKFNEMGSKI
ncbi:phytanoyl-CoA dioxygenase, peroxisomal-like isoform X2 [Onthophagus taurus]|uniref:phytanoyl-CoA dioxygenase, peroxisomal-like isoform X2 n=1 Tax=Onthophagus taurus TaxID=166361 RepID=UPI000C2069C8|nr:phytanoyl-CoA dioxygenase, peroxisomal-like [Onthophagus taurus]